MTYDLGSFLTVLSIVTTIMVGAVTWSVRIVINQIRALREDLKEYVRRETCRAHREVINNEIRDLHNLLKFGRRHEDGVLTELIITFNERMDRNEDVEISRRNEAAGEKK